MKKSGTLGKKRPTSKKVQKLNNGLEGLSKAAIEARCMNFAKRRMIAMRANIESVHNTLISFDRGEVLLPELRSAVFMLDSVIEQWDKEVWR